MIGRQERFYKLKGQSGKLSTLTSYEILVDSFTGV